MRLRGALASAFAVLWSSVSDASEPSTGGSVVAITSTGQCLKPAAVALELERLRPPQPGDGRLRLDIRESQQGQHGRHDVTVEVYRDGRLAGDRSFDDVPSDCGERIRLVAVAIAVALERLLEADEAVQAAPPASFDGAPLVAPAEGTTAPLGNRPPARSTKAPGPRESAALDVFVAAAAEAAVGVTPGVGAGAALDVGLYVGRRWSFGASGHWLVGLPYDLGPGEVDASLLVVALGGVSRRTRSGHCAWLPAAECSADHGGRSVEVTGGTRRRRKRGSLSRSGRAPRSRCRGTSRSTSRRTCSSPSRGRRSRSATAPRSSTRRRRPSARSCPLGPSSVSDEHR